MGVGCPVGSKAVRDREESSGDDAALLRRRRPYRVLDEAGRRELVEQVQNSEERRPRRRLVRPAVPDQIHDLLVPAPRQIRPLAPNAVARRRLAAFAAPWSCVNGTRRIDGVEPHAIDATPKRRHNMMTLRQHVRTHINCRGSSRRSRRPRAARTALTRRPPAP